MASTENRQQIPERHGPRIPPINPRFALVFVPVVVFWLVRRVASPEIAIGAGLVASLIVFFTNRKRGATGILAVLGIVIVGGSAITGIVLSSEKAFLANDPIGDYIIMTIALGSIVFRRPLFSLFARELAPVVERYLEPRHSVFFLATWLLVVVNAIQGTSRVFLLDNLSVDQYLLWSRAVSWSLNIALFAVTYVLIYRAVRARIIAMLVEKGTQDRDQTISSKGEREQDSNP